MKIEAIIGQSAAPYSDYNNQFYVYGCDEKGYTLYLHPNGYWHKSMASPEDYGKCPGYFTTREEAEALIAKFPDAPIYKGQVDSPKVIER